MNSETFIIAAAQSPSVKGDILKNISCHLRFVRAAIAAKSDVIIFPELSLTGYEPSIAGQTAATGDEQIFDPLLQLAVINRITIVAGIPLKSGSEKPYIGSLIFNPSGKVDTYRKIYLHPGEDKFFIAGERHYSINSGKEITALAICADIDNPAHPDEAVKCGAAVYAAGVMMTPNGIETALQLLSAYSSKYKLLSVMANYSSDTGGFRTAGKSAVWNTNGEIIAAANGTEEVLVIGEKKGGFSRGSIINLS